MQYGLERTRFNGKKFLIKNMLVVGVKNVRAILKQKPMKQKLTPFMGVKRI